MTNKLLSALSSACPPALQADDAGPRQVLNQFICCYDVLKNISLLKTLLDNGVNPNARDHQGRSALYCAVDANANAAIKLLLKYGADVDVADDSGITPLMRAVGTRNIHAVYLFLDRGPCFETNSDNGSAPDQEKSALVMAIDEHDIETAELLLARGADVNARSDGLCPLTAAIYRESFDLAKRLIYLGADVNAPAGDRSPIFAAAILGNAAIMEYLIDCGADIHVTNEQGWTPLHEAAARRNLGAARVLVTRGIDPCAKSANGATALMLACESASENERALAELLIKAGSAVDEVDDEGCTALHRAAKWGASEMIALLLESGADINAVDKAGRSALHYVIDHHPFPADDIVRKLIKQGARLDLVDSDGETPLTLSPRRGSTAILTHLMSLS